MNVFLTITPCWTKKLVRQLLPGIVFAVLLIRLPLTACAAQVYTIPIKGPIDRGFASYVLRVLEHVGNADAVILDLNTPGGLVDEALQIRDALVSTEITTIAYINKRAISAGALIALAADHIVMSPASSIGASTPIQIDLSGQGRPVSEKYLSYFRAEMRSTAEEKGRRGDIAEAMVDAAIAIDGVTESGKLLTLTTDEALSYEIAEARISSLSGVLERFDLKGAEIVTPGRNWAEQSVRVLTHPAISIILMAAGFLGLFLEFKTPGFGLGGIVGAICLALFFWGHFLIRLAGWEELILFSAGVILLMLEIFVIPGFGLAGILGILAIFAALALAMVGRFDLLTIQDIVRTALARVLIAFLGSAILSIMLLKFFPGTAMGRRILLEESEEGFVAQKPDRSGLIGKIGVALTPLHPSGTMLLGHTRYDVVSEGGFIDKDRRIVVLDVEGVRIIVREHE
ncbi:peptidase [candidate division KSB3 bacterium]|uniref:Peptidase n=1 Tax=candidate division KSB3 bacterium TaxID=2044937 RepID=A0A2G6EAF6_9BACT|nr:MAG: peptidase [candidate division KSB3 bacterium]PIE30883.1 MAG: peptidase [candidate division KSB3 bacterium]